MFYALDGSDGVRRPRSSSPEESRASAAGTAVTFEGSPEAIDAAERRKAVSSGIQHQRAQQSSLAAALYVRSLSCVWFERMMIVWAGGARKKTSAAGEKRV